MKKFKVLHIITRLDPGGSATNTIETVARLDPGKFESFLISGRTKDTDGTIQLWLKKKSISYAFFPDLQREISLWHDIKAFFKLYFFMRSRRFDLVHTHTSKAGILGRWAAKYAGVKYIIHTPHGHVFYGYFGKIKTAIIIWLERITALITTKIITLTDIGKKEHIDFKIAPGDKFVTIYSGIDIPADPVFKSQAQREQFKMQLSIPPGSFIFGCVARLDAVKGVSYLIDAMALVINKYPHSHLLLVGDGEEMGKLQKQIEVLGLKKHVTLAGYQKEVVRYIECMDVFVLASLNEGMGRVILEAMVCAKPIVATHVGGVPEIVENGHNGILVPARDPAALSTAMIRLIEDRELVISMAAEAKTKVGDKFNLDKMVRDIEHLYEQVLVS